MAANKFNEWWNDNCAEMFEWDCDNIARAAWDAAIKSSEALKPPHNSQSDAIKSCNNCFEFGAACERPMSDRSGCPKWVATF